MTNMTVEQIIDGLLLREGDRYTNDQKDSGGPTKWGVTQKSISVYLGRPATLQEVMDMTRETARQVYLHLYYLAPHFDRVAALSPVIANELVDTGVNCGQGMAVEFLQRALNAFNLNGTKYADIPVDRDCGPTTIGALKAYLDWRGNEGVTVMLRALNSLQGERYIDLAEKRPKDESFVYGWFNARVAI